MKIIFVNIYMVASDDHWVLIDAGLKGSAGRLREMADDLFGGVPPEAILLTHGHFDHRGAAQDLLKVWQVPVYAHTMELPYLTGQSAYPPPDPTTGGGLMSLSSFLYPKKPIDLKPFIKPLSPGRAPYLPEWEVIFTPGHSPGHVSFYRAADSVLIAGDAFVTTKQESSIATLWSLPILSGPPRYFTYDWNAAKNSVATLQALAPKIAATGHGKPMKGEQLSKGLAQLTLNFDKAAKPKHGRYVPFPALVNEKGVSFVPPAPLKPLAFALAGALFFFGFGLVRRLVNNNSK